MISRVNDFRKTPIQKLRIKNIRSGRRRFYFKYVFNQNSFRKMMHGLGCDFTTGLATDEQEPCLGL